MDHHKHDHDTRHPSGKAPGFREKGEKLLHHWQHHNEEHAQSFHRWADEFRTRQIPEVAALLDRAFDLSREINAVLSEAAERLKAHAG